MDWKFFIRSSRWCPRYLIGSRGKSALWPKSKEVLRMEYWILKCNNVAAKRIASIHTTNKLSVISQALGEKIRKIKKLIKGCESNLSLEISKIFLVSFVAQMENFFYLLEENCLVISNIVGKWWTAWPWFTDHITDCDIEGMVSIITRVCSDQWIMGMNDARRKWIKNPEKISHVCLEPEGAELVYFHIELMAFWLGTDNMMIIHNSDRWI